MKYLQLLSLILLVTACSNTKHVVSNTPTTPKKAPEPTTVVKDSIFNEVVKLENKNTELDVPQPPEPPQPPKPEIKVAEKEKVKINTYKPNTFNHNTWNGLLQKHVSNQGHVNYKAFKSNRRLLLNYITTLSENIPNDSWTKEDKLAYWINAYNAMTIDLILRHYPIKSIKDIDKPWDQRFWKLGDKWYNLNDIEHKILRKMNEPRIHFAIVCASFSCPKLLNKAFTASNLEAQLTATTKDFLSDQKRNNISKNTLELSKIFEWFSSDFTKNGSLISFINKYTTIDVSYKAKKHFKTYNWDLNE